MFDFFIALFGGLFYLFKYVWDEAGDEARKRKSNIEETIDRLFRSRVVPSPDEDAAVKQRVYYSKDTYEDLKEDLEFVYGVDCETAYKKIPHNWAYNLILSHMGKVEIWATYDGFSLGNDKDTISRNIKFCQRIEHNLRANGIDTKLYLKAEYSTYTKSYDYNPCGKHMVFEHKLFDKSLGKRLW